MHKSLAQEDRSKTMLQLIQLLPSNQQLPGHALYKVVLLVLILHLAFEIILLFVGVLLSELRDCALLQSLAAMGNNLCSQWLSDVHL